MLQRSFLIVCALTFFFLPACERSQDNASTSSSKTEHSSRIEGTSPKQFEHAPMKEPDEVLFGVALGDSPEDVIQKKGEPEEKKVDEDKSVMLAYDEKLPITAKPHRVVYLFGKTNNHSEDGLRQIVMPLSGMEGIDDFDALKAILRDALGEPVEIAMVHQGKPVYGRPLRETFKTGYLEVQANWAAERAFVGINALDTSEKNQKLLSIMPSKAWLEFLQTEESTDLVTAPRNELEQIGSPFRLGDFEYVVKSVTRPDQVGDGLHEKAPSNGAKWVVVRYTIENIGQETATALAGDLTLIDGQNRKFQPSSSGNTAASLSEGVDLALSQLQPGIKKKQIAVFEVPAPVADGFEVVVPEKGMLGSEKKVLRFTWMTNSDLAERLMTSSSKQVSRE